MATKKVYYEKVGRRYIPVREYDSDLLDAMPAGAHMVIVRPGQQSYKYHVDPAFAAFVAAGMFAKDALVLSIMKASQLEMSNRNSTELTEKQRKAFDTAKRDLGDLINYLQWPSANDIAQQVIDDLQQQAEELLTNPAVKNAYDNFILMCKLSGRPQDAD